LVTGEQPNGQMSGLVENITPPPASLACLRTSHLLLPVWTGWEHHASPASLACLRTSRLLLPVWRGWEHHTSSC